MDQQTALAQLSQALSNPTRLAFVAGLRDAEKRHFRAVKESLGISDSVLSRHASALEKEGLVEISKSFIGKRPATWYRITEEGVRVLDAHLEGLRALAEGSFPTVD
ncbi:transcriptional regulator [Brevibacterium litoralis]|uniref:transcriptional regulator n=1 Tax=Brevibacterium litoralis TaxID=3138935 RepID=UPI0032EDCACE